MPYEVKTKLGWWDLGDKRVRGENGDNRPQAHLGKETCLSPTTHPLWPRILQRVYKRAMRDRPIALVQWL